MSLSRFYYKSCLSTIMISCFFILSGCSSPSTNSCPSSKTSLEFYWVCTPSQAGSNNLNNHELTYNDRPVCLVDSPVLTSQSFTAVSDKSEGDNLVADVTLNDKATKAFRKATSISKGKQLAIVLKYSANSKNSGSPTQTSCKDETTILNIATVQTELGGKFAILGWQSQQQIKQIIASIKQGQDP